MIVKMKKFLCGVFVSIFCIYAWDPENADPDIVVVNRLSMFTMDGVPFPW